MLAALATGLVLIGALSTSVTNRILSGRAIVYVGTIPIRSIFSTS